MVKFISGRVVGALLLLGIEVAGAFILYRTFVGGMSDTLMEAADPPPFPAKTKETLGGTMNYSIWTAIRSKCPSEAGRFWLSINGQPGVPRAMPKCRLWLNSPTSPGKRACALFV